MKVFVRLTTALFIFVVVVIGSLLGVAFTVGGYGYITFYGIMAFSRKSLQLWFAHKNNTKVQSKNRTPIIDALVDLYQVDSSQEKTWRKSTEKIDLWRKNIWKEMGFQGHWHSWSEYQVPLEWYTTVKHSWNNFENALSVGVVVPIYKTRQSELASLMKGLAEQTYPVSVVTLILNDPTDTNMQHFIENELIPKYQGSGAYPNHPLTIIFEIEPEAGKRNAMFRGFRILQEMGIAIAINIDSDSAPDIDAVNSTMSMFLDENLTALTGDVRVMNPHDNLLTELTDQRYQLAFWVERAAQSNFGAMTCMSGPFLAIRTKVFSEVVDTKGTTLLAAWYQQTFLGELCTYGDDRHLTTLTLKIGQKTMFTPEAISYTDVPSKFKVWRKQQLRWSKSFWRETYISLPWAWKIFPFWTQFDVMYQTLFPFVLFGIVIGLIYHSTLALVLYGILAFLTIVGPYALVIFLFNFLFNTLYGLITHKNWRYIYNFGYVFLTFSTLLPIRAWAAVKIKDTSWGTK